MNTRSKGKYTEALEELEKKNYYKAFEIFYELEKTVVPNQNIYWGILRAISEDFNRIDIYWSRYEQFDKIDYYVCKDYFDKYKVKEHNKDWLSERTIIFDKWVKNAFSCSCKSNSNQIINLLNYSDLRLISKIFQKIKLEKEYYFPNYSQQETTKRFYNVLNYYSNKFFSGFLWDNNMYSIVASLKSDVVSEAYLDILVKGRITEKYGHNKQVIENLFCGHKTEEYLNARLICNCFEDEFLMNVMDKIISNDLKIAANIGEEIFDYYEFILFFNVVFSFVLSSVLNNDFIRQGENNELIGDEEDFYIIIQNVANELDVNMMERFKGVIKNVSEIYADSLFSLNNFSPIMENYAVVSLISSMKKKLDKSFIDFESIIDFDSIQTSYWKVFYSILSAEYANDSTVNMNLNFRIECEEIETNKMKKIYDSINELKEKEAGSIQDFMNWVESVIRICPNIEIKEDGFLYFLYLKNAANVFESDFYKLINMSSNYRDLNNAFLEMKEKMKLEDIKNRYLSGDFGKERNSFKEKYNSLKNGYEFEDFLYELIKSRGYKVRKTGKSGDQGADLIAEKNGIKYSVQAKYYSYQVDNTAIQEVVASLKYYKVDKAVVITNSSFTKGALELANANGVKLISGDDMKEILSSGKVNFLS